MQTDHDNFIAQLHAAFPATTIRAASAFDDFGNWYPDAAPYLAQLDGKSWDQLDREYVLRRSDALGFLGTKHLVAVLPVYLAAMVVEGASSPATGTLMVILAKPLPDEDTGLGHVRFDALLNALTGEQCRAIALALDTFASSQHPTDSTARASREALDRCWNTYLGEIE